MTREKTKKLIERLDTYLRVVRYNYSGLEQLSRLNILKDYYKTKKTKTTTEKLIFKIETAEQLSKNISLPQKVRGVFLTEGRPLAKYYSAEELKKSINNPINSRFPLMLDHEDAKAGKIIGVVNKIEYDKSIKGLRWWGHINDETFARNVLDKIITEVSATIFSKSKYDEIWGLMGLDLTFKELSLVLKGQEPNNYIEKDE